MKRLSDKFIMTWLIVLTSVFLIAATQGGLTIVNIIDSIAHTLATDSMRTGEIDPIDQRYTYDTLANVTNGADATYYYYVDMTGLKHASFQLIMDCVAITVTATLEGTIQDDCAPAACTYEDITNDTFGVASLVSAAAPASDIWNDDTGKLAGFKYVSIKIVAATGAATGDWRIDVKSLY